MYIYIYIYIYIKYTWTLYLLRQRQCQVKSIIRGCDSARAGCCTPCTAMSLNLMLLPWPLLSVLALAPPSGRKRLAPSCPLTFLCSEHGIRYMKHHEAVGQRIMNIEHSMDVLLRRKRQQHSESWWDYFKTIAFVVFCRINWVGSH